jgi:putative flippase GtrA
VQDVRERKLFDPQLKRRLLAEAGSLLRFGLVGGAASATYVVVALLAARAGVTPQTANIIGVVASTTVSFLGHLFYSFRRDRITRAYLIRFLILSVAVYAFSSAGTHIGVAWFGWPYWAVVLAVAATIPLFTWTAGRFWVFR